MSNNNQQNIEYVFADVYLKEEWKKRSQWSEDIIQTHMHLKDGFSIIAKTGDTLVGMVSIYWKTLNDPIPETLEGFIDIIEVVKEYRGQGIARKMIEMVIDHVKKAEAYQIRAWSSEDKIEAIQMWRTLKFGLAPAITYPNGKTVRGVFVTKVL